MFNSHKEFVYAFTHVGEVISSGGTSEKFEKLLERLTSKAAEFNNIIPYPILLKYWKKRISAVLQIRNVSIISEAYRHQFNFGAETLHRDYE